MPPREIGNVPEVPPSIGRLVALDKLADDGVPKAGDTKVGLFDNTTLPEPVDDVTPEPPRETGNVPVVPPSIGSPVAFVNVPEEGVPKAPPLTTGAPAEPTFTAKAVATPVPKPDTPVEIGKPVALVNVPEAGVPNVGVVIVGLANVGEIKCVFCWAKFVPSLHTVITLPAGMATPVPAAVVLPITVEL